MGRIRDTRHVLARLTLWRTDNISARRLLWTASSMASVSTCLRGRGGGDMYSLIRSGGCRMVLSIERLQWRGNSIPRCSTSAMIYRRKSSIVRLTRLVRSREVWRNHAPRFALVIAPVETNSIPNACPRSTGGRFPDFQDSTAADQGGALYRLGGGGGVQGDTLTVNQDQTHCFHNSRRARHPTPPTATEEPLKYADASLSARRKHARSIVLTCPSRKGSQEFGGLWATMRRTLRSGCSVPG